MNPPKHEIFISYPAEERDVADMVCAWLEGQNIKCWIAPRDIKVGMSYGGAILKAIKASRGLVLVYSSHANASTHVKKEVERAGSLGLFICTLQIEDVPPSDELEFFISSEHWLEASDPPTRAHLQQLANDVRELLGMAPGPPPPEPPPSPSRKHLVWAAAAAAGVAALALLTFWWLGPRDPGPGEAATATENARHTNATPGPTTNGTAPPVNHGAASAGVNIQNTQNIQNSQNTQNTAPPANASSPAAPASPQAAPVPSLVNTIWRYRQDDGTEYTYRFFGPDGGGRGNVLEFEGKDGRKWHAVWEQNGNQIEIRFRDYEGAKNRYQTGTLKGNRMEGVGRELETYRWSAERLP